MDEKLKPNLTDFGNLYIRLLLDHELIRLRHDLQHGKKCCPDCEQALIDTICGVERALNEMGGKYMGETYVKIGHEFYLI